MISLDFIFLFSFFLITAYYDYKYLTVVDLFVKPAGKKEKTVLFYFMANMLDDHETFSSKHFHEHLSLFFEL